MSKIVLAPAGGNEATRQRYRNTIERPVPIAAMEPFVLTHEYARLKELYPEGAAPTWGATPALDGANKRKWDRIEPGDQVFFTGGGRVFAISPVTYKLRSAKLAIELWGREESGQTWSTSTLLRDHARSGFPTSN